MHTRTFTTILLALALALGAAASAQQTVIRVLQPGIDQPGLRAATELVIERFEAEHPDIRVELESIGWGDAYQKYTTDLLAGNAPDVMYVGTRWIPAFAAMGGLLPLGERVSQERIGQFPEGIMAGQVFRDELYGLPVAFSTKALYYRTDLIDEPPTTWDELLETALRVTEEHDAFGIGIPGAAHVGTVQHFHKFLYQAGGDFFDEAGNVSLETPEAAEALAFYTGLYTDHGVAPNPIEFNREELPTLFGEGRIAMHINGPWARLIMDREPDDPDTPYATAVLPCGVRCGGLQGGDSLVVWSGTSEPDAAHAFVDFWTSYEPHTEYVLHHGLVPLLEGQSGLEEFSSPFWQTYVEMIDMGFPEAQPLAWEPFETIVTDMIQDVILGNRDVEAALAHAAERIRDGDLEPAAAGN